MICDEWIAVVPVATDSQFRLKNCRCGSDHAAYVQRTDGLWAVRCFGCGREGNPEETRHGAQRNWNNGSRHG
jgi:hypothetical protein